MAFRIIYRCAIWIALIAVLMLVGKEAASNLLHFPAKVLIVRELPVQADSIVVLLGGKKRDRTNLAADLFKKYTKSQIYLCDGCYVTNIFGNEAKWKDIGTLYRKWLIESGVPSESVTLIPCPTARDTSSELQQVARFLTDHDVAQVVLVTSAFHSRRVSIIWDRVSEGISGTVIGGPDLFSGSWWQNKEEAKAILYEYGALLKEFFRRSIPVFF